MFRSYRWSGPRRRRGFTLTEVMVAAAISGMMMGVLAILQYMGARTSHELSGKTHMRTARMQAIDAVRYRLVDARIGSCVIDNEGRRMNFENPSQPGTTSRFYFVEADRTLYFDDNVGSGDAAAPIARGPINITFVSQEGGAVILVKVKSSSDMPYQDIDEQEGEVAVYLRNS